MKHLKTFENYENESIPVLVSDYLNEISNKDKSEYKGHIKTKFNPGSEWNDEEWLVTELMQFLNNNYASSYVLLKFGKKFEYEVLKNILKSLYPVEFEKAENNITNESNVSESIEYFKDNILCYTIPNSELKKRGYTFQKLYANNYVTYRKKIQEHGYTVWCWSKGKTIEVDDWHDFTGGIIKFFKDNYDSWKIENEKLPRPSEYMVLYLNRNDGDILLKDKKEYYLSMKDDATFDAYLKKYENYSEVVLPLDITFELIEEINFLTK